MPFFYLVLGFQDIAFSILVSVGLSLIIALNIICALHFFVPNLEIDTRD